MNEKERFGNFTLWFTGLPSSGKSTVAKLIENELLDSGITIENLDADDLRSNLHPDLGFTKEERGINNRRIGYICKLLNKNNVASIVAAISPFREYRNVVRELIEQEGRFYLIYVKCPVEVCKKRDPKGLYEKAEQGIIPNFTGVSHPFEEPTEEEYDITVDTSKLSPDQCAEEILDYLRDEGILETVDKYTGITESEEKEIKKKLQDMGYL